MRILLLLIISCSLYSQRLIKTPYERHMESSGLLRLQLHYDTLIYKEKVLTWSPIQRLKVTLKTRLNRDIVAKLDLSNDVSDLFDDLDSDDYWSIGAYDVRGKFYINKIWRVTGRVMLTGIQSKTYFYSTGFVLKF